MSIWNVSLIDCLWNKFLCAFGLSAKIDRLVVYFLIHEERRYWFGSRFIVSISLNLYHPCLKVLLCFTQNSKICSIFWQIKLIFKTFSFYNCLLASLALTSRSQCPKKYWIELRWVISINIGTEEQFLTNNEGSFCSFSYVISKVLYSDRILLEDSALKCTYKTMESWKEIGKIVEQTFSWNWKPWICA